MKPTAFVLGTCALLAFPLAPGALPALAAAGSCANEIASMTKILIAPDGSESAPSMAQWQMGQHPPIMARGEDSQGGEPAPQWDEPQRPFATTSRETTGSAPSSRDDAGPAEPGNQASAMSPGTTQELIAESHSLAGAMSALERARLLDQQGKENECLSAVGMAKLISGVR
jgi:hypothetical protein